MRKSHDADRSEEDQSADNSALSRQERWANAENLAQHEGNTVFPNLFASRALGKKVQLGRKMRSTLICSVV